MVKKLQQLVKENESDMISEIRESASQIWLAGLGAFGKAQVEGGKIFEAMVKEGEAVQDRAKQVADDKFAEVKDKATGTWDKLEKVFEDRVARALNSLSVPSKHDIDALSTRVHELTLVTKKLAASLEHAGSTKTAHKE